MAATCGRYSRVTIPTDQVGEHLQLQLQYVLAHDHHYYQNWYDVLHRLVLVRVTRAVHDSDQTWFPAYPFLVVSYWGAQQLLVAWVLICRA